MTWRQLSDDVVVMSFPWRTLGIDFRRNVTLLRLSDGRVVIHSTAPFTDEDIAAICRFGEPAWLVEATLMHDTFAKEGHTAFRDLPYLAPDGFTKASGISTDSLHPPPSDWNGQIDVFRIDWNADERACVVPSPLAHAGGSRFILFPAGRHARLASILRAAFYAFAALVWD